MFGGLAAAAALAFSVAQTAADDQRQRQARLKRRKRVLLRLHGSNTIGKSSRRLAEAS